MSSKIEMRTITPLLLAIAVVLPRPSSAQTNSNEQVVYRFLDGTDGASPAGPLLFDDAGNAYGADSSGGLGYDGGGTVFELSPPRLRGGDWTETAIYMFQGNGDGGGPAGGLIADIDGNLYGATSYGSTTYGCGTVYEVSPPANSDGPWTETVLHSFQGGTDGCVPTGNLALDNAGNLYGATVNGGTHETSFCEAQFRAGCGTIFELSPPKTKGGQWTETIIYDFAGIANGATFGDGAGPTGSLLIDEQGALYGATWDGGDDRCGRPPGEGCGTVFELLPPSGMGGPWVERILHRFRGTDGELPNGVVFAPDGSIYGTTEFGGIGIHSAGVVFHLTPRKGFDWSAQVLHSFQGDRPDEPGYPLATPTLDSSGNLYGTTSSGGEHWIGTFFELGPPGEMGHSWTFAILYSFENLPDASYPDAPLTYHNGALFGTSLYGGLASGACKGIGCGTVYAVRP